MGGDGLFSSVVDIDADLVGIVARESSQVFLKEGDVERGKPLFTSFACAGFHSLDGAKLVGPSLWVLAWRRSRVGWIKDFCERRLSIPQRL